MKVVASFIIKTVWTGIASCAEAAAAALPNAINISRRRINFLPQGFNQTGQRRGRGSFQADERLRLSLPQVLRASREGRSRAGLLRGAARPGGGYRSPPSLRAVVTISRLIGQPRAGPVKREQDKANRSRSKPLTITRTSPARTGEVGNSRNSQRLVATVKPIPARDRHNPSLKILNVTIESLQNACTLSPERNRRRLNSRRRIPGSSHPEEPGL
jgi:hypothetical protein